ncbi:MATE family efflux transporter [Acutalibacter sp.]|uniref:MATE family efflux transporter n=1 Tax=Acutalibacter sp. TaxID=1918636 RepID=UPI0025C634F6|nr:MATE family efflux transporter [Acutalibacter sp.]
MVIIGGAAFAIVTFLLPRPIMRIFSTEEDVIELGAQYLRITAFIYLPHGVSLVVSNVIRSIGNAKLGLYVSIA